MRFLWMTLGWIAIGLGIAGAVLPLLPTTPFLLLAAYSFSKGSQRLHTWLVTHPKLGPPIANWQQERAIAYSTKLWASVTMVAVFVLSALLGVPLWALASQGAILSGVAFMIWTRPEPSSTKNPVNPKQVVHKE